MQQIQGGDFTQVVNLGGGGTGVTPPDMGGAVGDGYVVQMLNGVVSTYTTAGAQVGTGITLDNFWTNAGAGAVIGNNPTPTTVSDPRVIFDPSSGRWFASAITTIQSTNNNILVAVSNTSDPTKGFTAFAIPAGSGNFADYPTLGVNNAAVTIGTNNFGSTGLTGSSVYSIPKTSLTGTTPSTTGLSTFTDQFNSGTSGLTTNAPVGFTPQAVTDTTASGTSTTVLSTAAGGTTATTGLYLATISGANTSSATVTPTTTVTSVFSTSPVAPTQPGGTSYDGGDNRLSSGVTQVNNQIFFANSVLVNGLDEIQWGIIDGSSGVLQHLGLISMSGLYLTYPSIAANADGTFVISFNGSGSTSVIGDYYAVCSSVTFTCQNPVEDYTSPSTANNYNLVGGTTNRWGDYSWTTVDPTNPADFWLFQEYAQTNSSWGTVITQVSTAVQQAVPEPGSVLLLGNGLLAFGLLRRRRQRPCQPEPLG
ncbi:MAG TPA: PEP-CTERM sorting domain-containing protein [Rhodopila sp.]|nr:PEP-CTERM sorting domain-containing protein [Rhodopila sp.]